tara:strand:- start:15126 stop:15596 length:471 start_codon:yes stop_codon:yes gene_type:complete
MVEAVSPTLFCFDSALCGGTYGAEVRDAFFDAYLKADDCYASSEFYAGDLHVPRAKRGVWVRYPENPGAGQIYVLFGMTVGATATKALHERLLLWEPYMGFLADSGKPWELALRRSFRLLERTLTLFVHPEGDALVDDQGRLSARFREVRTEYLHD